jgi:hypothetical protein
MKNLFILVLFFLAACSKSIDRPAITPTTSSTTTQHPNEIQSCKFGLTEFNLVKRPTVINDEASRGRTIKITSGVPAGGSVILLDFDGYTVSNTNWNWAGDIIVTPANLTTAQMDEIVQRVTNDYSLFNVTVTTDEAVYNAANPYKRMRVVVTESWEWYGQCGGVSYVGSFTWGNNTPCFVFSSLLNYNSKYISEAASHEAGHTFGLYHQSLYDANGVKLSEYNRGQGSGEIGWAPIMGVGYYENLTTWHNGQNSLGATTYQDDVSTISNMVGKKSDDYSNTISGAAALTTTLSGNINNSADVDFFSINISTTKTISLMPVNFGPNDAGANLDLVLKVYDSQGKLVSTVDDPNLLSATTSLAPGKYYLSVSTVANPYATVYGMLGNYSISLL